MNDKKSARIDIPGLSDYKIGQQHKPVPMNYLDDSEAPSVAAIPSILAEDRLRMTIDPKQEAPVNSALKGSLHAAEERVRLYEEMKSKMARRKALKTIFDVVVLSLIFVGIIGGYIAWTGHKAKIDAEKTRLRLEEEAEMVRLAAERDRVEAEKREQLRLEQQRKKDEQEQQRLANEEAERERRDCAERYQMFRLALKENEFDIFTKSVTNDLQAAGGELCYLLPSEKTPAPFHWVVYSTNGVANVYRLEYSGRKEEMPLDTFNALLAGSDYIVAKGDKVYFHSNRKKPGVGLLDKSSAGNPAAVFFGKLSETMNWLQPSYDELTFDIFFTPKGEPKKKIKVENLLFGCAYSLQNVREAIEKEYPFNGAGVSGGRSGRKFKRTVKLWNGMTIRKGSDGITYVPMNPPPQRPNYTSTSSYTTLPGYRTIYHSRVRSYSNNSFDSASQWNALYSRALQEDSEERAFYESQRRDDSAARASAVSAAERKWREKIDTIFREGTLSYGIRKAKID